MLSTKIDPKTPACSLESAQSTPRPPMRTVGILTRPAIRQVCQRGAGPTVHPASSRWTWNTVMKGLSLAMTVKRTIVLFVLQTDVRQKDYHRKPLGLRVGQNPLALSKDASQSESGICMVLLILGALGKQKAKRSVCSGYHH